MKTFPGGIRFIYSWRAYQQRVLDELDLSIADRHLHVIAPPGSGKTVLGLEVALRLNRPVLILAPTLAIRNQWIQRFCELFLQCADEPEWISRDIRNPAFMTVITYQSLHMACNPAASEKDEESGEEVAEDGAHVEKLPYPKRRNRHLPAIVSGLKRAGTSVIIADEAHHLKSEWWQTLVKLKEAIDPLVVGLTATPPYDVGPVEWSRYCSLCGPVDAEITVPELVTGGDLCPHQDFVYLTLPSTHENEQIMHFREQSAMAFAEISTDQELIAIIEAHPFWTTPLRHLELLYANMEFYFSMLVFMNAAGRKIPHDHLGAIGERKPVFPALDESWLETFLGFYLFDGGKHFSSAEAHRKMLESKLRRYGIIEQQHVRFAYGRKLRALLASGIGKLDGIAAIVNAEFQNLRQELRLVVLCDYIRGEYLVNAPVNDLVLDKLGVMPVFERLRREHHGHLKLGVLTGSIVILPVSAAGALKEKCAKLGVQLPDYEKLMYDESYISLELQGTFSQHYVRIVTDIFCEGGIEALIGTKSLLGEGWDAPEINALVLASFVGSFVLSNQMRGRAIRTVRGNPAKTGNIWHLACIDLYAGDGGEDLAMLARRFRSFSGISELQEPGIENGMTRLGFPAAFATASDIDVQNERTIQLASRRNRLHKAWEEALRGGTRLVEEIRLPFSDELEYDAQRKMQYDRTVKFLLVEAGLALAVFGQELAIGFLKAAGKMHSLTDLLRWFSIATAAGMLYFGRKLIGAASLFISYRDISKDLQQIGEALVASLSHAGMLSADPAELTVVSSMDASGAVSCHLEGGTAHDRSLFINSLQEIIGPIDNPRYIIVRKSRLLFMIRRRDYHAVPECLGAKKRFAENFAKEWRKKVGKSTLIYTRTPEGRKLLLRSRLNALAAQFNGAPEHVSKWK